MRLKNNTRTIYPSNAELIREGENINNLSIDGLSGSLIKTSSGTCKWSIETTNILTTPETTLDPNFLYLKLSKKDFSIQTQDNKTTCTLAAQSLNFNNLTFSTKKMLADRILDDYAISILPSLSHKFTTIEESLKYDLAYLDRKSSAIRKTITAWDSYHIADIITSKRELQSTINTLVPNTSAVVNLKDTIKLEGDDIPYSCGDIIYKTLNKDLLHIKSVSSGFFYPAECHQIKNTANQLTNNYQMVYRFASVAADGTEVMKDANNPADNDRVVQAKLAMSTPQLEIKQEHMLYNLQYDLAPGEHSQDFLAQLYNNHILWPSVTSYIKISMQVDTQSNSSIAENNNTSSDIDEKIEIDNLIHCHRVDNIAYFYLVNSSDMHIRIFVR